MARPPKKGLDYFPLDCHSDTKLRLVEASFGLSGFAIIVKLWQRIYAEEGYYITWSEDDGRLFALENNANYSVVSGVVEDCLKRGIFNQEKFEHYSILTSKGIQERYLMMTEKRTGTKILDDYALLNEPSKIVSVEKTGVSSPKTGVSDGRKYTKESKVNKTKEKETKSNKNTAAKHRLGEYHHVQLTDDQYQKLMDEYPNYQELITYLDEYIEMKGYKAKNHYLAIKKWVVDAVSQHKREHKGLPGWYYDQCEDTAPEISDAELAEKMKQLGGS